MEAHNVGNDRSKGTRGATRPSSQVSVREDLGGLAVAMQNFGRHSADPHVPTGRVRRVHHGVKRITIPVRWQLVRCVGCKELIPGVNRQRQLILVDEINIQIFVLDMGMRWLLTVTSDDDRQRSLFPVGDSLR